MVIIVIITINYYFIIILLKYYNRLAYTVLVFKNIYIDRYNLEIVYHTKEKKIREREEKYMTLQ